MFRVLWESLGPVLRHRGRETSCKSALPYSRRLLYPRVMSSRALKLETCFVCFYSWTIKSPSVSDPRPLPDPQPAPWWLVDNRLATDTPHTKSLFTPCPFPRNDPEINWNVWMLGFCKPPGTPHLEESLKRMLLIKLGFFDVDSFACWQIDSNKFQVIPAKKERRMSDTSLISRTALASWLSSVFI